MHTIKNFIDAAHLQQTQQPDITQEQIPLKSEHQLISLSLSLMQKMLSLQPKLIKVFYVFPEVDKIFMTAFTALESEPIQQKVS